MNVQALLRCPAAVLLAAAAVLAGAMSACATDAVSKSGSSLEGTEWVIEAYRAEGSMRPIANRANAVVRFDDGRFGGSAGCNRLLGGYRTDGGSLTMSSQMASTMMACAPELMEQERAVVDAISRASRYRIEGERLEILDADGSVLLALAAREQAQLTGTEWRLGSFNNGKQAIVSVLVGADVTLELDANGGFAGKACNRYRGRYTTEGDRLSISEPIATTRMLCAEPEGIMEQESAYLAALQRVARFEISGPRLTLFDEDGARLAVLEAAGEAD